MVRRRQVVTSAGLALTGAAALGWTAIRHHQRAAGARPDRLRIATGPPGGVLRGMGERLAERLRPAFPETDLRVITTEASVENLALLRRGQADLAFAALDAAVGDSGGTELPELTAIARLFDSWMHILVPERGPITALHQLDGQRIAGGASGSGTRFGLRRLSQVGGVRPIVVTADQSQGAAALASGAVAAFVTFSGVPTPAVAGLIRSSRVRLLPLAEESAILTRRYGAVYQAGTLPATAYADPVGPGLAPAPTYTTPNLLMARHDLAGSVVKTITASLFPEDSGSTPVDPKLGAIDIRTAIQTMPIELHPGAAAYFRTAKP